MSAFLDTNVLVYAFDHADAGKQRRAIELMASLGHSEIVISSQVLSEFFVSVQRLAEPLDAKEAADAVCSLSQLRVIAVDATMVMRALDVRKRWQTSYWDGLILAAAERAGAETVYSEDLSDGQDYGGIRVVNPFS